jgi:hypothetical protein
MNWSLRLRDAGIYLSEKTQVKFLKQFKSSIIRQSIRTRKNQQSNAVCQEQVDEPRHESSDIKSEDDTS